jgi:hypothetical protein
MVAGSKLGQRHADAMTVIHQGLSIVGGWRLHNDAKAGM